MLYALSRDDGSVALTTVLPNTITVDGQTMPVVGVDVSGPKLFAKTEDEQLVTYPLSTNDMRRVVEDSVEGAVLTFYPIEQIIADMPNGDEYVSYAAVSADDIPTHRDYRNGWAFDGKTIVHDMVRCRDIHRDKLRELRKPKLAALDIAYQRADEAGDSKLKKDIAKQKQVLRDITKNPRIEAAKTVDDLKKITL
jgi:hypothetical protein